MEIWNNEDQERPIETYPGYLGTTWDGVFLAAAELEPLKDIDLSEYSELVDEHGGERKLIVKLSSGDITIVFSAYDDMAQILDKLPTVTVYLDNGPPDAGPASGGIRLFFIADGVGLPQLEESIASFCIALKSDFAFLKNVS